MVNYNCKKFRRLVDGTDGNIIRGGYYSVIMLNGWLKLVRMTCNIESDYSTEKFVSEIDEPGDVRLDQSQKCNWISNRVNLIRKQKLVNCCSKLFC